MNLAEAKPIVDAPILKQSSGFLYSKNLSFEDAEIAMRRSYLIYALRQNGGNVCKTARVIKVHRNTLTRNIHILNISRLEMSDVLPVRARAR